MSEGHFRKYRDIKIGKDRLEVISKVNDIIEEYAPLGLSMSVRQIYYQLVAAEEIPNTDKSYDRLGDIISDGRLAGLISWTAIEDRNRNLAGLRTWRHPLDAVKEARANYRIDKWVNQPWRPEVWVEKAAQEGTVGQICNSLQVDFLALRGYNSQSEAWEAGQRFQNYLRKGQRPIVFHLGDHDPSGLDMTRDNRERLELFTGTPVIVQRLALNIDQIREYDPPANYAKRTDSRYDRYVEETGETESWELDALDPRVIQKLIEDAILRIRDEAKWDEMLQQEVSDCLELDEVIEHMAGTPDDPEETDA